MKILHYSDKAAPNFLELYQQCDVLVTTGDLTLFDFAGLERIEDKKPAFGVYGNHDSGNYLKSLGIVDLHHQVYEFAGLKWGGFQGCLKYKDTGIMYAEEEAKIWADSFPDVDVLLLHAGPKGILDDPSDPVHQGSDHIRRYVLEKRPKVVFVGHQYSDGFMQIGETAVYRTYGARLIDV